MRLALDFQRRKVIADTAGWQRFRGLVGFTLAACRLLHDRMSGVCRMKERTRMSSKKYVRSFALLMMGGAILVLALLPACGKSSTSGSSALFPSSLGFSQPAAVK
jgi:hypothetical protein